MNEEIQFGLGLDTGKFFTGMRQAKGVVEDFKSSGISLGSVLKGAFAGFTIAAITATAKALLDFAHEITVTSENLGVSTTFLQQFGYAARKTGSDAEGAEKGLSKLSQKIGEARTGNEEAANAFTKWGIALKDANGNALDTEHVAENIAKRMGEIEDPAKRSAMAFELMGKGGAKLVTALRELEEFKKKSEGKILDEGDIARLESAKKTLDGVGSHSKAVGGKLLGAATTVFGLSDPNALLKKKFAEIDAKSEAGADVTPDVKKTKEYIAALRELQDAKAGAGTDKYIAARREEDEIASRLATMKEDSVEKVKTETELAKAHNKVLEEKKKLQDDFNKKQDEAAKKNEEINRRAAAMQVEVNHAMLAIAKSDDKLGDAKNRRSQLSIEDLTTNGFRYKGTLGEDQRTAFKIKRLEQQGEWNRVHGFQDDSQDRFNEADKLRATLSTNVLESDRFPFKDLKESSEEAAQHLQELLDKATGEGIKIIPSNGE